MNKINVYLSSFAPDNMKFLVEFLNYEYSYLKTKYYEVSFEIGKEKNNEFKITGIKELDDVLPYFESVFKKKSIKNCLLDDETSKEVVKLLCKEVFTKNEIAQEEKTIKINLDNKENTPLEENNNQNNINDNFKYYLSGKQNIKKYLSSKKANK